MQRSISIHQQLHAAREARGEDISTLSARVGVREHILRAIDEGRFDDLPSGIYGRAAIRAYASAVGRDPLEVLAACEPLLRPMEDAMAGLAHLRGMRRPDRAKSAPPPLPHTARRVMAAAIDAFVVMLSLLTVIAATSVLLPVSSLGSDAADGFGLMGVMLAITYFVCVGGVAGATLGEQLVHAGNALPGPITVRNLVARALRAATVDARAIVEAGTTVAAWALRPHARLQSSPSAKT